MTPRYRGLTWDHPRGFNALHAAAPEGLIAWDKQPLEGFESAPIADLCARYDLVVLDHPHLGEALAAGCLQPLDQVFGADDLAAIARRSIGASYDSYAMAGRQWALPLDAATQVLAMRGDRVDVAPATWVAVDALSRETGQVAVSGAGPHAYLSFLSVASAIEPACDLRDSGDWFGTDTARQAYDILEALYRRSPATCRDLNPIGILEHMSANDDVALCPLIYGYVNYADPGRARPIAFHDAPAMRPGGVPGTILGGTGIAISARATVDDDLRAHLVWLLSAEAQTGFIPDTDGQPSAVSAWTSDRVNGRAGTFYRSTLRSLDRAAIRPRHDGYIALQSAGSAVLRAAWERGAGASDTLARLRTMYHDSIQQGGLT